MSVLVFLDGVLKKDNGSPIQQGVALYRSMQAQRRSVILCKAKLPAEVWLKENNILKIDDLLSGDDLGLDDYRLVDYCRSKGPVSIVITADTDLATKLLEDGIPTLLFLDPKYVRPEFRPDDPRGRKSWEELQNEIDRQFMLYKEDPRAELQ